MPHFACQAPGLLYRPPLNLMYRVSAARTRLVPAARLQAVPVRHYSSPLKVFVDTIREQIKKNKEIQEGVKSLQDESGKLAESDALKKAKEMYEKAKVSRNCYFRSLVSGKEREGRLTRIFHSCNNLNATNA